MKESERMTRGRFLILLAGMVPALWSLLKPKRGRDLEMREADFYTRQDLAG
jgi:hypothetical protein